MFNELIQLDITISLFFRNLIVSGDTLAPWVMVLSDFEVLLTGGLLVGLWLYGVYKKEVGYKIIALDIFYAIMLAFLVYWILQFGLPMRPRPESITSLPPLINHLPDNSFPSGHAIFAGASVVAIGYFFSMSVSSLFAFFGVIMLLCRVISGVHYFGDVFVGVIIGALLARLYIVYRDKNGIKTPWHTIPLKLASIFKL
ncbi:MAG: phosphatase PAP2 family protein [Candidatus Gracilibacteria bacterium]|nr:phosphatase PAP2 family protein [Candidatus Gracilibacteria bacterium]